MGAPSENIKILKLIAILLLSAISYSQQKQTIIKPSNFTYNWQINDGVFTLTFANTQYLDYGYSNDRIGTFTTNCKQTYLDFINKLIQYGRLNNHDNGYSDRTDNLEIITDQSFAFILMIDNNGRVFKISKQNALTLANQLNQTMWISQIQNCVDLPCVCN